MGFIVDWFDKNFIALLNGLAFGFLLYTLSVGMSLILGMMRILSLAHGIFYLLGSYIAYAIIGASSSWVLYFVAMGVAVAVGLGMGAGLTLMMAPLLKKQRDAMDQAMVTLGIALAGGQLMLMQWGGEPRSIATPPGLTASVDILDHTFPRYRLFIIGFGIVLVIAVTYTMERTSLGALVRATVADPVMVRALGIDSRKIVLGVLSLGTVLAVVAGVLGAPFLGAYPGLNSQVLTIAFVVVVIGGMGSAKGAFVGALLIGEMHVVGTQLVPVLAPFIMLGTMSLALIFRPRGLFGDVQLGQAH